MVAMMPVNKIGILIRKQGDTLQTVNQFYPFYMEGEIRNDEFAPGGYSEEETIKCMSPVTTDIGNYIVIQGKWYYVFSVQYFQPWSFTLKRVPAEQLPALVEIYGPTYGPVYD